MPGIKYQKIVYYFGSRLTIIWAVDLAGFSFAKEYFDSIGPPDWAKLDRILHRLGDNGRIVNIEQFRPIGDKLYEVKGGARRLVGYFIPGHFVLTHGFNKRGGGKSANKFPKTQRQKAIRIKEDFDNIFKKMKKEV